MPTLEKTKSSDIQSRLNNTMSFGLRGPLRDMQERHRAASAALHEIVGLAELEDRGLTESEKIAFDRGKVFCDDLRANIEKEQCLFASMTGGSRGSDLSGFEGRIDASGARSFRKGDSIEAELRKDMNPEEVRAWDGLHIGNFCRMQVFGPANERERRAMSTGGSGSGSELVPAVLDSRFIDKVRERAVCLQAGCEVVSLESTTHSFARILSDPSPGWRAELGDVALADLSLDKVTFAPKSIAVLTKVSHELLQDAINGPAVITHSLASAMANAIDLAITEGTGADNQPQGLRLMSGLQVVDLNDSPVDYDDVLELVGKLEAANVQIDRDYQRLAGDQRSLANSGIAIVTNPKVLKGLRRLKVPVTDEIDGSYLAPPPVVAAIPQYLTNQVRANLGAGEDESTLFLGDWGSVALGVRQGVAVQVLKERFADNLTYGFLVSARIDVRSWRPASMGRIQEITVS